MADTPNDVVALLKALLAEVKKLNIALTPPVKKATKKKAPAKQSKPIGPRKATLLNL